MSEKIVISQSQNTTVTCSACGCEFPTNLVGRPVEKIGNDYFVDISKVCPACGMMIIYARAVDTVEDNTVKP